MSNSSDYPIQFLIYGFNNLIYNPNNFISSTSSETTTVPQVTDNVITTQSSDNIIYNTSIKKLITLISSETFSIMSLNLTPGTYLFNICCTPYSNNSSSAPQITFAQIGISTSETKYTQNYYTFCNIINGYSNQTFPLNSYIASNILSVTSPQTYYFLVTFNFSKNIIIPATTLDNYFNVILM